MDEDQNIIEDSVEETQTATVQDGTPYPLFQNESVGKKVGMFAFPCLIGLVYLTVIIFVIVMFYRLVRATEKIAAKIESGIIVKKENSDTI